MPTLAPTDLLDVGEAEGQGSAFGAGTAPFEGVIGVEGMLTGDGRLIAADALEWAQFPLPLRWAESDIGGHDGAVVVGNIERVERRDNGDIYAWGVIDLGSSSGREVARLMRGQFLSGVSMDLDSVDAFEANVKMLSAEGETLEADGVLVTQEARVRAATLVAIPAFDEARLALIASQGGTWRRIVGNGAFNLTFTDEEQEFQAIRAGYARENEQIAQRQSLIASLAEKAAEFSPNARRAKELAAKVQELTGHVPQTFAYNPLQWRDPANGHWIDMPSIALGKFLSGESGQGISGPSADKLKEQAAKVDQDISDKDIASAQADADKLSKSLSDVNPSSDGSSDDLENVLAAVQNADSFEVGNDLDPNDTNVDTGPVADSGFDDAAPDTGEKLKPAGVPTSNGGAAPRDATAATVGAGDTVLIHGKPKTIESVGAGPNGSDGDTNTITFDDGTSIDLVPDSPLSVVPKPDSSGGPGLDPTAPGTDENGIPYTDLGKAHTALHKAATDNGSEDPSGNANAALDAYKQKRVAGQSHADALKETASEANPPKPKLDSKGMVITTPKQIAAAAVANPDAYNEGAKDGQHIMGGLPDSWAIDASHAEGSGATPAGQGYYILRPVRGSGKNVSMGDYGHFDTPEDAMAAQKGYEDGNAAMAELNSQVQHSDMSAVNAAWPEPLWSNITNNMLQGLKPKGAVTKALADLSSRGGPGSSAPTDGTLSDADLAKLSDSDLLKQLRGLLMKGGSNALIAQLEAEAKNRGLKVINSGLNGLAGETEVLSEGATFPDAGVEAAECVPCKELSEQGVTTFAVSADESKPLPGSYLAQLLEVLNTNGIDVGEFADEAIQYLAELDVALYENAWEKVFDLAPQFFSRTDDLYSVYLNSATGTPAYESASAAYQALEQAVKEAAQLADDHASEFGKINKAIEAAEENGDTVVVITPSPQPGVATPLDPDADGDIDIPGLDEDDDADDSGDDSGDSGDDDDSGDDSGLGDSGGDGLDQTGDATIIIDSGDDSGDSGDSGFLDSGSDSGDESGADEAWQSTPEGTQLTALMTMISGSPNGDGIGFDEFEAVAGEVIAAAYAGDGQTVGTAAPVLLAELDALTASFIGVQDILSQIDQVRDSLIALLVNGPAGSDADSGEPIVNADSGMLDDSGLDGAIGGGYTVEPTGEDKWPEGHTVDELAATTSAAAAFAAAAEFNWVQDAGGLPLYIKNISKHLVARGMDQGHAIATAVNTVKRWSRGGNGVKADTVAKSLAALADWEVKKKVHLHKHTSAVEAFGAMKDSSFPISNEEDLKNAIQASGRAKDKAAAKKHIISEAHKLGKAELIPDSWKGAGGTLDFADAADVAAVLAASTRSTDESLIASGGQVTLAPVRPPKAWFANPKLTKVTPFTVTEDGRVFGHLATWDACHMESAGLGSSCVRAPRSSNGYAGFHLGYVTTAEGEDVPTGRLVAGAPHADPIWGLNSTLVHYSHSGWVGADVRVGEDAYGIWVAGALRPDISANQLRALKASPLSGDWRTDPNTGRLELVAGLAVNAPGFKVPRPQALVASVGTVTSMQAVGLVAPKTIALKDGKPVLAAEDLLYLKKRAGETKAWAVEAGRLSRTFKETNARNFAVARKMAAITARVEGIRGEGL